MDFLLFAWKIAGPSKNQAMDRDIFDLTGLNRLARNFDLVILLFRWFSCALPQVLREIHYQDLISYLNMLISTSNTD